MSVFDLKSALRSVEDSLSFAPFAPIDNLVSVRKLSGNENISLAALSESTALVNNLVQTLTSLLRSNFLVFLKTLLENASFKLFIESFLAYRAKPFADHEESDESSVALFKLDKLVFSVFFRASSPNNEHHSVAALLSLTPPPSHAQLDEQYAQLVDQLHLLKFPYLMELAAIVGESNQHLSHRLFSALLRWKPLLHRELTRSLEESERATLELVKNAWQALERFESSTNSKSLAPKKGARVVNKSALLNKTAPVDQLREVHDLAAFALDIVYSLHSVFAALDKAFLSETALFETQCLSREKGMLWFRAVQMIYEIALPLFSRTARHAQSLSNEEFSSRAEKIQELVEVSRYWCLHSLKLAVDVCFFCHNHNDARHKRHNHHWTARDGDAIVSSQTWIDVLSSRLDINGILIGATLDAAQLHLGALASDFLQSCDRSPLLTLLKSALSVDEMESLDYCLNSLCLEDSSLPSKSGKIAKAESTNVAFPASTASGKVTKGSTKAGSSSSSAAAAKTADDEASLVANIEMIRGIFPDLGEGFIEACLGVYKHNPEEVIEALLMDNLAPQLSSLDRSLKKAWVGKVGLVRDTSTLLVAKDSAKGAAQEDKISYKAFLNSSQEENKKFAEVQKALVKNIEKAQQYDAYIVDKEYDDDYDDQYDDSWASKKPAYVAGEAEWEGSSSAKAAQPAVVDWKQQMAETRRYNTLLREEEKEIEFWKQMEIANRKEGASQKNQWKKELAEGEEQSEKGPASVAPARARETQQTQSQSQKSKQHSEGARPQQKQGPPAGQAKKHSDNKKPTEESKPAKETEGDSTADKSKQDQKRQFERKEKRNDSFRKDRRMKKERAGGFIPGTA